MENKLRWPVLKFLDRYFTRILAGAAFVLGLAGAAAGLFAGVKRGECAGMAFCACIAGLFAFLPRPDPAKRRSSKPYISPYVVRFDDEGIAVTFRNKPHEAVKWADLVMVAITIRDCFLPVPFWMLAGSKGKGGCVYPNDAVGAVDVLRELQRRLPNFDNRAVAMAMGMMTGYVIVWEKPEWKAAQLKSNAG